MARGVQFGRKPKLTPHQIAEAKARRDAGETTTDIGRSYNVSITFDDIEALKKRATEALLVANRESRSDRLRHGRLSRS